MNYVKKTLAYFILHTCVGIVALIVTLLGNLPDGYKTGLISGIAGGFLLTGILGIIYSSRLLKNPQKAKAIEIMKNEERVQLIRLKTHASIFSVMLYLECLGVLVAGLLAYREVSVVLAFVLIFQLILYFGFATYYSRKY